MKSGYLKIRKYIITAAAAVIVFFSLLWFSDFLPLKIAKGIATDYIQSQPGGANYLCINSSLSGPHNYYFVYFINIKTSVYRNIGVDGRFLPHRVCFDSEHPGIE